MGENSKPWEMIFELKQQTPMIHFQYDEPGACLRASEVKPKLDKYIIEKLGGKEAIKEDIENNCDQSQYFNFFVRKPQKNPETNKYELGKDWQWALDYKMKIKASGEPTISSQINKLYFGNMGNDNTESKKETVFYENNIELTIICFNSQLRTKIEENIKLFFLNTNFGTRQSKGFGGYLCKKADEQKFMSWDDICSQDNYKGKTVLYAGYGKSISIDASLNNAAMLYAIMKSGINRSKNQAWRFVAKLKKNPSGKKEMFREESPIREILNCLKKDNVYDVCKTDLELKNIEDKCKKDKLKKECETWKKCLDFWKVEKLTQELINNAKELVFYDKQKYIKGFILTYGKEHKADKAFIKGKILKGGKRVIEEQKPDDTRSGYEFLRILLGMAENYKYDDDIRKATVYVHSFSNIEKNGYKLVYKDGDKFIDVSNCDKNLNSVVERFKSPITMKIYREGLLFIFDEIPLEILGKWFLISEKKEFDKVKDLNDCENKMIQAPAHWEWKAFLDEFIKYYKDNRKKVTMLCSFYNGALYLSKLNILGEQEGNK